MINYTKQLKTYNWNEYGKKTGLGRVVNTFYFTDSEDKFDPSGRVLVLFDNNINETYVLFDNFGLLAESKNSDELVKLAEDPNATLIVSNKNVKRHANDYVKYMVQTHDDNYKQESLSYHNKLRSSYIKRMDTVSKKRESYFRVIEGFDKNPSKQSRYAYSDFKSKIDRYGSRLIDFNQVIKFQTSLIKLIEKTEPSQERE